jgi:putative restriction endonuclease
MPSLKRMRNWTREETIVAFNVYCKIPFKSSSKTNPIVIEYAKILGRTPSALNMKIGNLGRLDPELKLQGITGLKNGSKIDKEVWEEFNGNWDDLAYESEKIIANLKGRDIEYDLFSKMPEGKEKEVVIKARVNQSFFRSAVLSAYNNTCCITGINMPELLIASHIIPWKQNIERTNPKNGLCLNSLHDRAFDRGYIAINNNYQIVISKYLQDLEQNQTINTFFLSHNKKIIQLPDKFLPSKEFLNYHYEEIFKK